MSVESRTHCRASATEMIIRSVRRTVTSGWEPASVDWHPSHSPHPAAWHWRAAANAIAAFERPDPGGPVKSQAWVIPLPAAACCSALDHPALSDQRVPHGHGRPSSSVGRTRVPPVRLAPSSSGSTRARIAASISSTGRRASTTR